MITKGDIKQLPSTPGVYLFERSKKPIYIGKSVHIKERVLSHLRQATLSTKEKLIIENADSVNFITTLTNFDALLLEAKLIKKHKPKYNVSWKDDKNYLYIKVTSNDMYPKIFPVRKEDDGVSHYFGPLSSTRQTHSLLYELRRVIPFCTQKSIGKRGCFYSKIGLCHPCPNNIEQLDDKSLRSNLRKEYKKNIAEARSLLSGRSTTLIRKLNKDIKRSSDEQDFELALKLRNRITALDTFLTRRSYRNERTIYEYNKPILRKELQTFLTTHFNRKLPPNTYRIECYDISHTQFSKRTGSMVVCEDGSVIQSEYKKFSIKGEIHSDVHMLTEVLSRRLAHHDWHKPDLIVLDGGKPQLKMVSEYLSSIDTHIPLISIAKNPDRIILSSNAYKPTSVVPYPHLFKLFQALRDESHRFAKKYHVHLRTRNKLN